jgi:hypothetical protein
MKKFIRFIAFVLIVFALSSFWSCSKKDKTNQEDQKIKEINNPKNLPASGGKTLEMILVVSDNVYKGELKDTIGSYFMKACEALSRPEPLFDLVQMPKDRFFNSEMFQKHRNILVIDYATTNKENTIFQNIDYKSFPQAYFQIIANNRDSLYSIINRYASSIIHQFYNNEHRRVVMAFQKLSNTELTKKLQTTFKFSLTFSNEFSISTFKDNFAWIRKDYKSSTGQRTLNVLINKTPFIGDGMFKEEKIIELRDNMAKENVPGPVRGSYMGTETRFPYSRKVVSINGVKAIETRGLWRLFNDFMGGPFVNYCFVDSKNNQFIMIDCFLYAPNQNQRDELMQLESIVYSLNLE